jgi:electron transfer flavoprotein alpha subunit
VISGGRGLKGEEQFSILKDSGRSDGRRRRRQPRRRGCGLVPYAMQIGQTGKTVKPDIYFAVASPAPCSISRA